MDCLCLEPLRAQVGLRGLPSEVLAQRRKGMDGMTQAARAGDVLAMTALGIEYRDRSVTMEDFNQAVSWLGKASEKGYAPAQYHYGILLVRFRTSSDYFKVGVGWLEKAATQGFTPAVQALSQVYVNTSGPFHDTEKAIQILIPSAEAGDPYSQFYLAEAYERRSVNSKGLIVGNDEIAMEWYEKAAQKGLQEAQARMGGFYYYSHGDQRRSDFERAEPWFRLAAQQGNTDAMVKLARCLTAGPSTSEVQKAEAIHWLELSTSSGNDDGKKLLEAIRDGIRLGQSSVSTRQNVAEHTRKAQEGNVDSMILVAQAYWKGEGVRIDRKLASDWFHSAAEKGNGHAMLRYAFALETGQSGSGSMEEAIKWYEAAARIGFISGNRELLRIYALGLAHPQEGTSFANWLRTHSAQLFEDSLVYFGELYWTGSLVSQNVNRAMFCYSEAAKKEDPIAQNRIGEMHLKGVGGKTNLQEAIRWFRAAAKQNWAPAQLNLANLYATGVGDSTDIPKAWILASLAAHQHIPRAAALALELEAKLDATQLSKARKHLESAMNAIPEARFPHDWQELTESGAQIGRLLRCIPPELFP